MYLEPFPAWPLEDQGRLLHVEPKAETAHLSLGLQHYEVPIKDAQGHVTGWGRHDWDLVKLKPDAPGLLNNDDWERMMEPPEEVAAMKYKRVVRIKYRHKLTGAIISREQWQWNPTVFRGGALVKPYIHYPDGTRALLYLEEWRATSGKVEIMFPEGMIGVLPTGAAEAPLVSGLRELYEEAGVRYDDKVTITLIDEDRIQPELVSSTCAHFGMGQERWMYRVAVRGLEKGEVPRSSEYEADELIKTRIVPIDNKLKHHFDRYTAENGYLINPDMQNEIDHIAATLRP